MRAMGMLGAMGLVAWQCAGAGRRESHSRGKRPSWAILGAIGGSMENKPGDQQRAEQDQAALDLWLRWRDAGDARLGLADARRVIEHRAQRSTSTPAPTKGRADGK